MKPIDAGGLLLRPIHRPVAQMLLAGGIPRGLSFAPGYPSPFTREVMEMVVGAPQPGRFGPYFMVRKADDEIVGEIGCSVEEAPGTGKVGYAVIERCWSRGYATEALRALLDHVLAEPDMRRVVAETMVENTASRRVMEKAGMTFCGKRVDVDGNEPLDLVVYEALVAEPLPGDG